MDVVILAAGRGSRLKDITPPYFKPLIIVDGEPLIRRLVRTALRVSSGRIVIVAAPENALPLCQVLGDLPAEIVLQRQPNGPGDALLTGLRLVTSPEVQVLLGDNVVSVRDAEKIAQAAVPAVGVVLMHPAEAERYTYLTPSGCWVEKLPCDEAKTEQRLHCWVGPLKLRTDEIKAAIERRIRSTRTEADPAEQEIPIGPLLNEQGPATLVPVSSVDIGVPAAWLPARTLIEE
ncbi:NTP transferase domain-containing protein [Saccharopolyspora shandongensis]|uniref:nucleotidyltransferase family protein n=1 Tax=Saccharopolyspora shandongensis TaxID=418495 RepID=UPI00342F2252